MVRGLDSPSMKSTVVRSVDGLMSEFSNLAHEVAVGQGVMQEEGSKVGKTDAGSNLEVGSSSKPEIGADEINSKEEAGKKENWKELFKADKIPTKLDFLPSLQRDGKRIVKALMQVINEGINAWSNSLVI